MDPLKLLNSPFFCSKLPGVSSLVNDPSLAFRLQAKLPVCSSPVMMSSPRNLSSLQKEVWNGSIPLEIRLASSECRTFDHSDPYLVFP